MGLEVREKCLKEICNGVRNPEWGLIERVPMGLEFREKCQREFWNGVRSPGKVFERDLQWE